MKTTEHSPERAAELKYGWRIGWDDRLTDRPNDRSSSALKPAFSSERERQRRREGRERVRATLRDHFAARPEHLEFVRHKWRELDCDVSRREVSPHEWLAFKSHYVIWTLRDRDPERHEWAVDVLGEFLDVEIPDGPREKEEYKRYLAQRDSVRAEIQTHFAQHRADLGILCRRFDEGRGAKDSLASRIEFNTHLADYVPRLPCVGPTLVIFEETYQLVRLSALGNPMADRNPNAHAVPRSERSSTVNAGASTPWPRRLRNWLVGSRRD